MSNQEELETLAGRISFARKSVNRTEKELSGLTGVTVKTVRSWESGKSNPGANKMLILPRALGVSSAWLMSGVDVYNSIQEVDETGPLQIKLNSLQTLHEQMALLLKDIQSDIYSLQTQIENV